MNRILVTGAGGQLGKSIQNLASKFPTLDFLFLDNMEMDITQADQVLEKFREYRPDYCINCAAYTNVEQAEIEPAMAMAVNAEGVQNLVGACMAMDSTLLQISTDYVFSGESRRPYDTSDVPGPINQYGQSKLKGETYIRNGMTHYFIIRTSWLYSEFGKNFAKTIIRNLLEKKQITVVNDVFGSPTYAGDLAEFILKIIIGQRTEYGIYHFCNKGSASWYDFALEIAQRMGMADKILPIKASEYPTLAKRPIFSVLLTLKTEQLFNVRISDWRQSLAKEYTSIFASVLSAKG